MTVVAAAIIRAGRVLVLRRAPGRNMAGAWEFPGGKVERGEGEEAALERELGEELGISGRTGALVGQNVHGHGSGRVLLKLYRFEWREGEIGLSVHDALRWVLPRELADVDFSPADVPLAARLAQALGLDGAAARNCQRGGDCP